MSKVLNIPRSTLRDRLSRLEQNDIITMTETRVIGSKCLTFNIISGWENRLMEDTDNSKTELICDKTIVSTSKYTSLIKTHRAKLSQRLRFKLLRRDGFRCQYCGRTADQTTLEIDHIVPLSLGGSDNTDNMITSCTDCNQGKSAEPIIPLDSKIIINKFEDKVAIVEPMLFMKAEKKKTSIVRKNRKSRLRTTSFMTARKKGGTCIISNVCLFKLGQKYLVHSPEANVLNITLYQ
ncbi:MAG: HNH endonuclease [Candidatus Ratteibacteria bacterium]|nr:HNH endonuclease [Candidatus Ratteibacteria bacterium]